MVQHQLVQEPNPECVAVVHTLCERFGWALLERASFAERLRAHAAAGAFRSLEAAAFNLYSAALHLACSGAQGRERQERAYVELARLLQQSAGRYLSGRNPAMVEEVLGEIYEQFTACRTPGAFIAFAQQRLRNLIKRSWNPRLVSLDAGAALLPAQQDDELDALLDAELRERVAACREQFLGKYPAARLQFEAVWMKFMLGLDDATISRYLDKTPNQIYVLRSRGLKRLRAEPAWQALADDLELPRP